MALKFQPPNIPQGKTKEEAIQETLGGTLQTLPSQWAAYKIQRMNQEMQLKTLQRQMANDSFTQTATTKGLDLKEQGLDLDRKKEDRMAGNQAELLEIKRQLAELAGQRANSPTPVKPPAGYRYTQDGNLETIPGGPADAKLGETEAAKTGVSGELLKLRDLYTELQTKGAIVDTSKDFFSNFKNKVASSDVGQAVGGAIGTESQSIRQKIRNMQPVLISEIKKATGMSAKSMDSNAELKFMLQAVTDPSKDLQSNLDALDTLEKRFGVGASSGGVDDSAATYLKSIGAKVTPANLEWAKGKISK